MALPLPVGLNIAAPLAQTVIDAPDTMAKGAPNPPTFFWREAIGLQSGEDCTSAWQKRAIENRPHQL
jgi:hypothetical protein